MDRLRKLVIGGDETVPLDVAALELASIEFPGLEPEPFLELLDSYATELAERVSDGEEFVEAARQYLFDELGFCGNQADYYHPRNSCLNEVLVHRAGLPITLSVVYMELARRLGRNVAGIGLPGHFLVRYSESGSTAYIDPFHGGRILSVSQCRDLALEVARIDIDQAPASLEPVTRRHIVVRMLNNLRNAYQRTRQISRAIAVLDLLIEADPTAASLRQETDQLRRYLRTLN
ncbi:MAG: hypothetical protein FJW20_21350 [Acidimicrobiia bacterium]|nr:hypothetical protein [Acidimicrobiia bacterium]